MDRRGARAAARPRPCCEVRIRAHAHCPTDRRRCGSGVRHCQQTDLARRAASPLVSCSICSRGTRFRSCSTSAQADPPRSREGSRGPGQLRPARQPLKQRLAVLLANRRRSSRISGRSRLRSKHSCEGRQLLFDGAGRSEETAGILICRAVRAHDCQDGIVGRPFDLAKPGIVRSFSARLPAISMIFSSIRRWRHAAHGRADAEHFPQRVG